MSTQHKDIADPYRHEPKDIDAVTEANHVYMSDGAGSGSWAHPNPHAGCYHENLSGTSETPALADTYEVLGVVTTLTHAHEFAHTSPQQLTYTGTKSRHVHLVFNMSFEATAVAGTAGFKVYKNGSPITGSYSRRAFTNGSAGVVALHFDDVANTNDYYEIWWEHVGTVRACTIYSTYFFIMGMPD